MDVTELHDEENLLVQMQDRWENYGILDAILNEMSHEGFTETDADDFWDDMMDLRKAKNIR